MYKTALLSVHVAKCFLAGLSTGTDLVDIFSLAASQIETIFFFPPCSNLFSLKALVVPLEGGSRLTAFPLLCVILNFRKLAQR